MDPNSQAALLIVTSLFIVFLASGFITCLCHRNHFCCFKRATISPDNSVTQNSQTSNNSKITVDHSHWGAIEEIIEHPRYKYVKVDKQNVKTTKGVAVEPIGILLDFQGGSPFDVNFSFKTEIEGRRA